MIHLLDTNILIYLIRNQPPSVAQRVDALPGEDRLCMSFITWAELLKGAERSTRKTEVLRRLDALARQVAVIYPSGPAICRHYAEQFTRLKDAGFRYDFNSVRAVSAFIESVRLRRTIGTGQPSYRYERDVEQFFRHSPAVIRD